MELFIVPLDVPRARRKRARGKELAERETQPSRSAGQPRQPQPSRTTSSTTSKLKSKVWLDFKKISKDGDMVIIAQCNICKAELSGKSSNGTSHLLRHTEAQHKTDQATMNNFFLKSETEALHLRFPCSNLF